MKKVFDYIEKELSGIPDDRLLQAFRRRLTDEVTDRANELTHRGLKDENVLCDLIIGEHPDLRAEFKAAAEAEKKKKRAAHLAKAGVLGAVLYSLAVVLLFFIFAFAVRAEHSWMILEGGFSLLLTVLCALAVNRLSKVRSVFHPLSRILIAFCVMLAAAFIFLVLMLSGVEKSYIVFIAGAVVVLLADSIYAAVTKQHFAVFFRLLYVPMAAALIYVCLCLAGVMPWHPGWIMIPASLIIDLVCIIIRVLSSDKNLNEAEVDEEWS